MLVTPQPKTRSKKHKKKRKSKQSVELSAPPMAPSLAPPSSTMIEEGEEVVEILESQLVSRMNFEMNVKFSLLQCLIT